MNTETVTLASIAGEAYGQFETANRPNGETYTRLKDGAPEWLSELVRAAHGDFLPDDFRYTWIRSALGHVHDADVSGPDDLDDSGHEFADQAVDVYTGERLRWLASNLERPGYVDEAAAEGLIGPDTDEVQRIGIGQYMEAQEVFASVADSLRERFEEVQEAADEG